MSRSTKPHNLLKLLEGRDRRSIGRVNEIIDEVLANPKRFRQIFQGMLSPDPIIRMRSADAVEKITLQRPELLQPFKYALIRKVARIAQQEVQWHVAQLLPRLKLTSRERAAVVAILKEYLSSKSGVVKTFSMQALAEIAEQDISYRAELIPLLATLTRTGTPAMSSRGRKLLARLTPPGISPLKEE